MDASKGDQQISVEETAIIVQHDWFSSTSGTHTEDNFFIGIKRFGSPTEYSKITCKEGKLIPEMSDRINVEKLTGRRLKVEVNDIGTTIFYSPIIEFSSMHSGSIQSVDVSCTGRFIVSAGDNGQLIVWNSENGEIVRQFAGHIMDVNKCRFFPSGLVVLSGGMDMSVRVWSVETGQCPRTFKGHRQAVTDLGIIERGKEVMSCSKDGTVKIWNCGSAECIRTFKPDAGYVNAIAVNCPETGSNMCSVATQKGKLCVYDLRDREAVASFISDGMEGTAITFDGKDNKKLYMGSQNGVISAFDMRASKLERQLKTCHGAVNHLVSNETFGIVASFSDGTVCTFDVPLTSTAKNQFSGADCDPIYDFAFLSNGQLYTACRDRIVRKYEIV